MSLIKGLKKVLIIANGALIINENNVGSNFKGFIMLPAFSLIAKFVVSSSLFTINVNKSNPNKYFNKGIDKI
ncbi:MAG: hypothetical protein BWX61_00875 [Bacteroidetes bacterium ADurb.Bin035]|nr:MAG: hypothetical protein BWX61_00875 [Bacteroidetes bacterium ADurb.Bin035]